AIFCGADFWQDKAQNAVNPIGFTSILTKCWRKSARKKRGSDYARHPERIPKKQNEKTDVFTSASAASDF
ncbi:MAG: hypothetical protein IJO73_08160, partial [Clostridia bacterium]|nr:hypothetical protein [Clostridia bacterium]